MITEENKNQTQGEQRTFARGIKRGKWINSKTRQTVLLIQDTSLSMEGDKARAAQQAARDLVSVLAQPMNKEGFYVGVVNFDVEARIAHHITKAVDLNGQVVGLSADGSGTNITAGLALACDLLTAQQNHQESEVRFLKPVVLIFTDGCHNVGDAPYQIASQVKAIADLVTIAYGDDADEKMLQDLASTPQHFYRCTNGNELRAFMAAVGDTMTGTFAAGTNASEDLGYIGEENFAS